MRPSEFKAHHKDANGVVVRKYRKSHHYIFRLRSRLKVLGKHHFRVQSHEPHYPHGDVRYFLLHMLLQSLQRYLHNYSQKD